MVTSGKSVFSNILWRFFERCGAQGVSVIVSLVLARILGPEEYGVVAIITVFITILQVFADGGMGSALIQKKDADDLDFSSAFYFNIGSAVVLYAAIFFAAPYIAVFYERPELSSAIRVMSLVIFISALKNVQHAYVSRNLMFKKFFFATLGGTIGAAIIGISMAKLGFGYWALIAQHLFNMLVDTCILWICVKWRPRRIFSWERVKRLFSFGWKILVADTIYVLYDDLRTLIIGKKYSAEDLAYFNQGKRFPAVIMNNINTSIDSVLLPALSNVQNSKEAVQRIMSRAIKTSSYIMTPILLGTAACASPLIRLLLTDKWMDSVIYLQIFCLYHVFQPLQTSNGNAIKALGRSDLTLKVEIIKKCFGLVILLSTMLLGVKAMALGLIVNAFVEQIINSGVSKRLLGYGFWAQAKDILPSFLLSMTMSLTVYSVSFLKLNDIATLAIQIPLGIAIYLVISKALKFDTYYYCLNMVKQFIKQKN